MPPTTKRGRETERKRDTECCPLFLLLLSLLSAPVPNSGEYCVFRQELSIKNCRGPKVAVRSLVASSRLEFSHLRLQLEVAAAAAAELRFCGRTELGSFSRIVRDEFV